MTEEQAAVIESRIAVLTSGIRTIEIPNAAIRFTVINWYSPLNQRAPTAEHCYQIFAARSNSPGPTGATPGFYTREQMRQALERQSGRILIREHSEGGNVLESHET